MKVFGQLEKAQLENTTSDTAGHPKGMATYRTDINQVKVSNGTAYKAMIDEDSTQSMSNKTLASPTVTGAATLEQQGSTPSTPSAGFNKMYFKTDGKPYYVDSAGTEVPFGSGSGSGVKNYIENGDAELTSPLPSTYADAAQPRPVDGTGGSPTITFTRTLASPLAGDASWLFTHPGSSSYQGEGVSFDFTIDPIDQAKVLQIRFGYEIASGTYSGGTSSTDSDLIAYIYDVTNAVMIEPSVIKLDGGVSGVKYQYRGEFQTASNSTSYRLILHKATTNTSAFTMKIDDIEVTPNVVSRGAVITEWFDYTPTAGLTGATWSGKWRRVGDCMELQIYGVWSGAAGGTNLTLSIPSGYAVDTAKIPTASFLSSVVGVGSLNDSSAGAYYDINLGLSGNGVFATFDNGTLGQMNGVTPTGPFTIASGDAFTGTFRVPIQGWGTSQTLSQDGGTRVVAARASRNGTTQTGINPNNSAVKILFNSTAATTDYNKAGAYDTTNSRFVAIEPGVFKFSANIVIQSTNVLNNVYIPMLYKNGAEVGRGPQFTPAAASQFAVGFSLEDEAKTSGDYYEVYLYGVGNNSASTLTMTGTAVQSYFTASKVQGPQQIAATETIAALGVNSAGTSIPNSTWTSLTTPTIVDSTHGTLTTGGVFTAPATGRYNISTWAVFVGGTDGVAAGIRIRKNGTDTGIGSFVHSGNNLSVYGPSVSSHINLVAGDTLSVQVFQNSGGSLSLVSSTDVSSGISIHRVGI